MLIFIASLHVAQNIWEAITARKKSTLTYCWEIIKYNNCLFRISWLFPALWPLILTNTFDFWYSKHIFVNACTMDPRNKETNILHLLIYQQKVIIDLFPCLYFLTNILSYMKASNNIKNIFIIRFVRNFWKHPLFSS